MESDQLHVPASFFIFRYGMWLTQEPPRRFSVVSGPSSELQCQQVSIHCTVFAIWIITDFVRWNSCFLQGQRKNSSILVFLPCHPTFACQTLLDCLCTFDAFHISNSIRYFWASVCVCTICIDVKRLISAGGRWGTLQSAANEDAAMFLCKRTCFIYYIYIYSPAPGRI